ncbi:MAG TPA: hypothetical protein ENJ08_16595 [Gammaproteobacteria bacterium]|nr:hypothetical protein [Gammaproteobacteria bacterium]
MICLQRMRCDVVCSCATRIGIMALMATLTHVPNIFAADLDVNQIVSSRWATDIDNGDTQLFDMAWRQEARWRFDDGGRLTGRLRLRVQTESGTRSSDIENGSFASATQPQDIGDRVELGLRELYYERSLDDWYLTIGKQQVVWGKADGLKVLDVVNPQSFREFILEDFEQSRIPLWTFNAERSIDDWLGGDWTLQLLWLPDQTYHALPTQNATYGLSSPRLVPQASPGVSARIRSPEKPNRLIADSDAGIRLSGFVSSWDVSINYLYQYDNLPALHQRILPGSIPVVEITPRYHRTHLLGGTFSRATGDWVVRGELGYFSSRYFLSNDPQTQDGVATSPELSVVIGLDWSGGEDTFISAQLFQSWLPDYRQGFTRPRLDTSISFLLRRKLWNDTLQAELLWIANTNDSDGLLRPRMSYELEDNLEIWAGLDIFYGNHSGLFGQFGNNDRFYIGVRYGL